MSDNPKSGWEVYPVRANSGILYMHVVPVEPVFHDLSAPCPCGPKVEEEFDMDGNRHFMVIHNKPH